MNMRIPSTAHLLLCSMVCCFLQIIGEASVTQPIGQTPDQEASETKHLLQLVFREKGDGKTLKRVEVRYGDEIYFSDLNGKVEFPLQAGIESLEVYRDGYQSEALTLKELNQHSPNHVFLFPELGLNQVVVTGKGKKAVSKKEISIEEAQTIAPRGDPVQITKLLPGVQTSGFGPDVVIRGSAPDDSSYFIDGIEVPFIFHSIGGLSVLPKNLIENIEFYAGGFGASRGEVTGGIVVLESTAHIPERPKTEFVLNLPIYSGVYHERPLSKTESMSASIRRSYLEYLLPYVIDDTLVVPYFYDAHLRYLKVRDGGHTKVVSLSSLDGLELIVGGTEHRDDDGSYSFSLHNYFGALGVEHSQALGGGWRYMASPQYVYSRVDQRFVDNFVDIKANEFRIPLEFQKRLGGKKKLFLGVEGSHQLAEVTLSAVRVDTDDPFVDYEDAPLVETQISGSTSKGAGWTSLELPVGPFVLVPGLRAFYSTTIEEMGYDPRFMVTWDLWGTSELKAAVGRYSASPLPRETSKDYGNPDLGYEHSRHYILGWKKTWNKIWETELQSYVKSNTEVVRSSSVQRYLNSGNLRSRGIEVFIRRRQTGRWFGWLAYTWSVTEEKKDASSDWVPASYDQTHVFNLIGAYKLSAQWSLGAKLNIHSGDRYTPVNEAVFHTGLSKYQPRYLESQTNAERLPDWHQLDIYTSYEQLFNYSKIKYRVGIEYLSADQPAYDVSYNYDYTKKSYVDGLPPIPYFEISGEF